MKDTVEIILTYENGNEEIICVDKDINILTVKKGVISIELKKRLLKLKHIKFNRR